MISRCYIFIFLRVQFYTVAPWPLRSLTKAEEYMGTLVERAPNNRRNRYYKAVVAFRQGRWQRSIDLFKAALDVGCVGHTQLDFCDFATAEAKRGIEQATAELELAAAAEL